VRKYEKEFGSWLLCSAASVGAAYLNTDLGVGKSIGDWTYNLVGGDNGGWFSVAMGYGIQKATEGFISGGLMSLAMSYDFSAGQWKTYDWNSVFEATSIGFGSGFVSGMVGGGLGGIYSNGNLSFLDRKASMALNTNISLFYAGKLNNFANTIGSIAGEGIHYAYGGNFRINLGGGIGIGITHDGRIVNDTSGGIGLVNIVEAIGSLNYVGFQARNVGAGDEGWSRISYVNMGYLSGDRQNMKTALDVINNRKSIKFDLEGSGNYGYAGEDNRTIHLNQEAILREGDPELRAKLAHYTATAMHEGLHIDQHIWLAENGGYMDDVTLERMAYMQSTKTLALLNLRFGLNVGGSQYEDVAIAGAEFARTGNPYGLDMSGRSQKLQGDVRVNQTRAKINQSVGRDVNDWQRNNNRKGFIDSLVPDSDKTATKTFGDTIKLIVDILDYFTKQKVYSDAYQYYSQGEKDVNVKPNLTPLEFCMSSEDFVKFKQGVVEYVYSKSDDEIQMSESLFRDIRSDKIKEYKAEVDKAYQMVNLNVEEKALVYQFAYQLYLSGDTNDKVASTTELKVLNEAYSSAQYQVQWEKEMQAYLNSGISSLINKAFGLDNTDLWQFVPNNYERLKDFDQTKVLRDTYNRTFSYNYKDYLYNYYYKKIYNYYNNKKR
jgi:hypothetical protein